jgi:hypothetical protein
LFSLHGGMNISHLHARIYYDFDRKRFGLEVLGKNGGKTSVVSSRKPSNEFTSFLSEHLRAAGFIQDCHPEVSDMLIY